MIVRPLDQGQLDQWELLCTMICSQVLFLWHDPVDSSNGTLRMKLIGAGFGRTGTLSLKLALEIVGFGPCYHMREVFNTDKNPDHLDLWDAVGRGEKINWQDLFQDYQATVDWPAATFYQELLVCYPQAKVLLSVRDPEKWYQSVQDTIFSLGRPPDTQFQRMVDNIIWNGTFAGRFTDKAYAIEVFQRHIQEVQQHVPPDRLLIYTVPEGWTPLCSFLGVPVPDQPFPRVNDTASFQQRTAAKK